DALLEQERSVRGELANVVDVDLDVVCHLRGDCHMELPRLEFAAPLERRGARAPHPAMRPARREITVRVVFTLDDTPDVSTRVLPRLEAHGSQRVRDRTFVGVARRTIRGDRYGLQFRSEEHTSELQSREKL